MSKFEVGQCWKDGAGKIVTITKIDPAGLYPVEGDKGSEYDQDGKLFAWQASSDDLIELLPADNLGELGRDLLILALQQMQATIAEAQKLTTQNSGMWHRLESIDDRLFACLTVLGD